MIAIFVVAAMASCIEDSKIKLDDVKTQADDGTVLVKIDYWTPSTDKAETIQELMLDASGNLTGMNFYSSSGELMRTYTALEKNASKQIIKLTGTNADQSATAMDFEYNADGKIVKRTLTIGDKKYFSQYTYDNSKRISTEESWNNEKIISRITYEYTGTNVNPSSYKRETLYVTPVRSTTYTLTFDNKKNPSQAAGTLVSLGMIEFYTHNVLEEKNNETGDITTNEYTYNASGYATSKKGSNDNGFKFQYR